MAESNIKGMHVAILAIDGFEQAELTEPKKALEEAGAITTIVAPQGGDIQGMRHHDKSENVAVEQTLDEADPSRFDAVLLPGGALNAVPCASSRKHKNSYKRWTTNINRSR